MVTEYLKKVETFQSNTPSVYPRAGKMMTVSFCVGLVLMYFKRPVFPSKTSGLHSLHRLHI